MVNSSLYYKKASEVFSQYDIEQYVNIKDERPYLVSSWNERALKKIIDKYPHATAEQIDALDTYANIYKVWG
jgi:hypothetical protein